MDANYLDPTRRVPISELLTAVPSNSKALPNDVLQDILDSLDDFPTVTNEDNTWYQTVTATYIKNVSEQIDQIKEEAKVLISEIVKLNDPSSKFVEDNLKKIVEEEIPNVTIRVDVENIQKKVRRNIIFYLKGLNQKSLSKLCKSTPLSNVVRAAQIEKEIENSDDRWNYVNYGFCGVEYACLTNDEDMLIRFGGFCKQDKNQYFGFVIEKLLSARSSLDNTAEIIDGSANIKTTLRMMKKLKVKGYKCEGFQRDKRYNVHHATENLLFNNKFTLIVKFAEVFEEPEIAEIYKSCIMDLSEGHFYKVAKEMIKKFGGSDRVISTPGIILSNVVKFCFASLAKENRIEDGFTLINLLKNQFDIQGFVRYDLYQVWYQLSSENLKKMIEYIKANPDLDEENHVEWVLQRFYFSSLVTENRIDEACKFLKEIDRVGSFVLYDLRYMISKFSKDSQTKIIEFLQTDSVLSVDQDVKSFLVRSQT